MALRGTRIENFDVIWCLGASGGYDFCVSSTSFQKSNVDWPHQPPAEKLPILVKNWVFDDPFHKKGLVLIIWVLGMIQSSASVFF